MSAPVKVQIFGQSYSIQGELDGKYVQKLAKYVDDKMHEIADVTKTVDTQKVAVLAALAIADELHNMQRDRGDHDVRVAAGIARAQTGRGRGVAPSARLSADPQAAGARAAHVHLVPDDGSVRHD